MKIRPDNLTSPLVPTTLKRWRTFGLRTFRKLADLRVVGRKTAVEVYELAGFAAEVPPTGWQTFEAGLSRFRDGDFVGARAVFEQLPADPAAQRYAQRCAHFEANPPTSWDGVWGLTEK